MRDVQKDMRYLTSTRVVISYELPFAEIVYDFFDRLKSVTKGFASLDYEIINYKEAERDNIVFRGGYDERDLYIEPTVLQASSRLSTSMKEEIFGPVLPVLTYSDLRDAIYFINQGDKPLALYLFTRNRSVEKQVMKEVS